MSALPLAHAAGVLVNLLYIAPLVIVVAMLAVSSLRDRRAEAAEAAGPEAEGSAAAPAPAAREEQAAP